MSERTLQSYVDAAERQFPDANESESRAATVVAVDVRLASGDRYGFAYSDLIWIRLRGTTLLDLAFASHTVTVEGRRLTPLYKSLLARTCRKIAEGDLVCGSEHASDTFEEDAERTLAEITRVVVLQRPNPTSDPGPEEVEEQGAPSRGVPEADALDPLASEDPPDPAWRR